MKRALGLLLLAPLACSSGEPMPEDGMLDDGTTEPTVFVSRVVEATDPLPADLEPTVAIARAGAAVLLPEPGAASGIQVHHEDGSTESVEIARAPDGTITVIEGTSLPPQTPNAAKAPDCADKAYSLEGFRWTKTLEWKFRSASVPSGLGVAAVEDALVRSATNITGAHNNCGLTDQVSATHKYLGRTTRAPAVAGTTTTVTCGKTDGMNVVGFGVLPKGTLGVTCYWYDGNKAAVESDIKLSTAYRWYTTHGVPSGCSNRFGIEATMTHEWGHAFGLGHVSESTHGSLTMSTSMGPCSSAPTSLGLGDVLALRARY